MPAEYYLDFTSEELTVTAGVNRARLLTDLTGEGLRTLYPVNPWIKPKDNQLTAFLSWPEDKPHAPGLGTLKVRLFLADPGKPFPSPQKVLAEFSWPALPKIAEEYPYSMTVPFPVDDVPPCTLWRDAEAVARLEPADREAIIAQAEMLRLALTGGDAARAAEITRYKHEDDARSHGQRPEAAAEVAIEQFNMIINAPKLRSESLTPDNAVFESVAGGQVWLVSRGSEGSAILLENDDERYEIDVFVSRIGGKWRIVR